MGGDSSAAETQEELHLLHLRKAGVCGLCHCLDKLTIAGLQRREYREAPCFAAVRTDQGYRREKFDESHDDENL
jgi:hypothetical protein